MTAQTATARVLLVDDHPVLLRAVREILASAGIDVVGEAATVEDAERIAADLAPDVVLLDIGLGDASGLTLVDRLHRRLPETRIVMLTVSNARADLVDAMSHGATGYLTKDLSPEALVRAVRAAAAGEVALSPRIAAQIVTDVGDATRTGPASRLGSLSRREHEVLELLRLRLTDRQAAERLGLSLRTVESHVANILLKLHVRSRTEAARALEVADGDPD